ncbi:hypothetical protein NL676_016148 [Syzygium grande]|nr:hypothetical protein NL676_016148 [Syzygium grande]
MDGDCTMPKLCAYLCYGWGLNHCRSDVRPQPSPGSVVRAVALAAMCLGAAKDRDYFFLVSLSPGAYLCYGWGLHHA